MNAWFSPTTGPWLSLFSLLSLLAIAEIWVRQGRHRKLVMSLYVSALGIGCILLAAGLLARIVEQPAYVTRPLLVAGIIVTVIFGAMIQVVRSGYAQAEQRRILARDM